MKLKHLISYVSLGLVLSSFFISSACAKFPDIDLCKFEGKGTSDDPYVLCTYEDLMDKLQEPSNLSAHFALYGNIDARESWSQGSLSTCVAYDGTNVATAACEGWEPVGNLTNPFTGSLDGRGHSISNLWMNRDTTGTGTGMGFFGVMDNLSSGGAASIRNLGLPDLNIQGGASLNNIGGLLGYQAEGIIENSYVTGMVYGEDGGDRIGALVGQQDGGTIENSYAAGDVNGEDGTDYLGGLVGRQNGGTITNSYATGAVNGGAAGDEVGGLLGYHFGGDITNSYAIGAVDGGSGADEVGGLLGYHSGGDITNSYAIGAVDGGGGADEVGGLIGSQDGGTITNSYAEGDVDGGASDDEVGGLVGYQVGGNITNSYAIGTVDGGDNTDFVGGLLGYQQGGTIEDSYAAGTVDGGFGTNTVGGLVGSRYGSITGVNYYVANPPGSTNGIGGGTNCNAMECIQEMDVNFATIFGALFSTMGWMDPPWQNRSSAHPCIRGIDFGPGNGCPP